VFWTPEGKGWGIKTLEQLLYGAFVFEFVEEILTNKEMETRSRIRRKRKGGDLIDFSMMLDADEKMEETLIDDEALCLDANCYGNIARFLNHHCGDANLVHYNVHIESRSTQLMYFSKQLTLWFMHPMLFMVFLNPTVDL
jgi:hypothetical protein